MDQIYLFFEKIKKVELDHDKMNAVIMANCLLGTSQSTDASAARQKNRMFNQFMDSLNWDNFVKTSEEKAKPKTADNIIKKLFGGTGIPVRKRNKKQVDN